MAQSCGETRENRTRKTGLSILCKTEGEKILFYAQMHAFPTKSIMPIAFLTEM